MHSNGFLPAGFLSFVILGLTAASAGCAPVDQTVGAGAQQTTPAQASVPTPTPTPATTPGPASTPTPTPNPAARATEGAQAQAAPQPRPTPTGSAAEQASDGGDVAVRGRQLFVEYSCGTCHGLAAAGASAAIGPSLDRNPRLTEASVQNVITHGQGAMPSFGGLMSEEEIDILTRYILQVATK